MKEGVYLTFKGNLMLMQYEMVYQVWQPVWYVSNDKGIIQIINPSVFTCDDGFKWLGYL